MKKHWSIMEFNIGRRDKKIKTFSFIVICVLLICLVGCARVIVSKSMPDGTQLHAEYTRLFDQNIDGFKLKTPEGWEVSFEKQSAEIEMAFKLGVLSAEIGKE